MSSVIDPHEGPGRVIEEELSLSNATSQTWSPESQPSVRRRRTHQDPQDSGNSKDPLTDNAAPTSGQDARSPGIRTQPLIGAERLIFESIRAKGTIKAGDRYINLAPLPQFQNLDTTTYLLNRNHQNYKATSQLKVPTLYNGYDAVTDQTVHVILFAIAEKCQFLDNCMAQLFRAMLPSLSPDFVKHELSCAEASIKEADPGQPSSGDTTQAGSLPRSTFLGELGHYLESIAQGNSHGFMTYRIGDQRLEYLQDALELPYWDMIVRIFQATSNSKRASGISQTIMENAVAGCYQFIKTNLQHLKELYANGDIGEPEPTRILEGVRLRLRVLEKYTSAIDHLRELEVVLATESKKKAAEPMVLQPGPEHGDQVLTFSVLFIVLAIALVPGMIGFAKAAQDGEMGSTSDADFCLVIRDTIMTILGAALSAIQMHKLPSKSSAHKMAWVFSFLGVSLGTTAITLYPLANKAYSSLCGFFAQFFSIASLAILVLDGQVSAASGGVRGGSAGDGGSLRRKKVQ